MHKDLLAAVSQVSHIPGSFWHESIDRLPESTPCCGLQGAVHKVLLAAVYPTSVYQMCDGCVSGELRVVWLDAFIFLLTVAS